jgi:large subunit ribosomal protein L30
MAEKDKVAKKATKSTKTSKASKAAKSTKTAKKTSKTTKAAKTTKATKTAKKAKAPKKAKAAKATKTTKATKTAKVTQRTATAGAGKVRVRQVRSGIGHAQVYRRTLRALGIKHHQDEVVLPDNPSVRGMLFKVRHLVRVTPEEA